jgi:diguanylate cyclase
VRTKEQEAALSKSVLDLMKECGVAPTPEHYELFYAYAARENPALSRVMGDLIASHRPLTSELLSDVRNRSLSGARGKWTLEAVGLALKRSLDVVLEAADGARTQAGAYDHMLSLAHRDLADRVSPGALRRLVRTLGRETVSLQRHIRALESELSAAAREVASFMSQVEGASGIVAGETFGLENRRAFDEGLQRAIRDAGDEHVSIFLCRVDRLQRFTEQREAQFRHQLLRLVAGNLAKRVGPNGNTARFDDETFAVTLRQTPLSEAEALAEEIQAELSGKALVRKSSGERLGRITLSVGVAQYGEGEQPRDLVRRAQGCLDLACHLGCNFIIGEDDPRFAEADIDAA